MSVYLDYVFIENFAITLVILLETKFLIRKQGKLTRLILGSLISSFYICLMLIFKLPQLDYLISKMLLNMIVIYIVFSIINFKEYLKIMVIFYVVTSVNIGANIFISQMFNIPVNSLKSKAIIYLGGCIASYFIFKWLWKMFKDNLTEKNFIYKTTVKIRDKSFEYKGFLDTGNSLKDVVINKFVVFAKSKDRIESCLEEKDIVKVEMLTALGKGERRGCIIRNFEIEIKNKKYTSEVIVVFDNSKLWDDKNFDMILNYQLLKEIGGISI